MLKVLVEDEKEARFAGKITVQVLLEI